MEVINFIVTNKAAILAFLVATSEVLALIPGVKQNSIFEVVVDVLKKFVQKK
jgi:hypothetical protein